MNVICQHCKTKLNIPDHQMPTDQDAEAPCPKCGGIINIRAAQEILELDSRVGTRPGRGLEDRINAMVCVGDTALRQKVFQTTKNIGCFVQNVSDARTAIEKMEYQVFQLLIVDQTFDQSKGIGHIMQSLNTMDMSLRRQICAVVINSKIGTNDHMAALHASVNNILNLNDIAHLEPFLVKAIEAHRQFYTIYNDSLKKAGKA